LAFLSLLPFLFRFEKKRLVVRRAAATHHCRELGMEDTVAAFLVRQPLLWIGSDQIISITVPAYHSR
jgi:hypothetical protein